MQQETKGSVKGWAIVVGLLGLIPIFNLSSYPITSSVGILSIISVILGSVVLYAGIRVSSLSLKTVSGIFWAQFAYLVINFLYLLISGNGNIVREFIVIIEAIIIVVLIKNVKKLSQQSVSQPPIA